MSRVVFLNRFFHPDTSATSQILTDLATHLAAAATEVHVVTSALPGLGAAADPEIHRGVTIHRVGSGRAEGQRLASRALRYIAFSVAAARQARRLLGPGDILVAKTDPPLLPLLAAGLAASSGCKIVNWLQDLYPEVAIELGVPLLKGLPAQALLAARNASLRRADMNVAISEGMAERLLALPVAPDRIRVIHNWTDDQRIRPVAPEDNPLRRAWGLETSFVVGYSGNLGRAHEAETILAAAEILRRRDDIVFLFIGGGHHWATLQAQADARALTGFIFKPLQPAEDMSASLSAADIHWVSLRPELDGLILPSKLYGIAAAARPCIAITGPDAELARLVDAHGSGRSVGIGRAEELAGVIEDLADDPAERRDMGRRARSMLETSYSRAAALERWGGVIAELGTAPPVSAAMRGPHKAGKLTRR